jgi:hypothetical protein
MNKKNEKKTLFNKSDDLTGKLRKDPTPVYDGKE